MDCEIGVGSSSPGSSDLSSDPVVFQHRVLLFCRLKSMLDIVENDLFKLKQSFCYFVQIMLFFTMLIDVAAVVNGLFI